MSGKLAVVAGITGNQGGSVARAFLEAGYKVRGLTRDPSKPSGKKWTDQGVELVAGDYDKPETLKSAFKGANVIFGTTDFWSNLGSPAVHEEAAKTGKPAAEIAHATEVTQGKAMIDAAAATVDTLERFVLSTLSATKKLSKGKYVNTHHFDAKAEQVEYLNSMESLAELKKKTSTIQMPYYINNWKMDAAAFLKPAKQSDGTYLLRVPISPQRSIPMGDVTKIAGPFVVALTKAPPGKNLVASAGFLTFPEWCDKVGKHLNITIKFEQMEHSELEQMIPGGVGLELADMFMYYSDFGYDGGDPTAIYPDKLGVDVKFQTVDEYIKEEDWSTLTNQ